MIRAALIALFLMFTAAPVSADVFDDAMSAYNRGDYAAAASGFRTLAEQGDATAQSNLGDLYFKGQGVPQNYAEAVKWYRRAAEQGNAYAQGRLGVSYYEGLGVPQNYVIAHMWVNLAAANGSPGAAAARDALASLSMMTPADISEAQRRANKCLASNYRDCD